jgi:hypothetical protein
MAYSYNGINWTAVTTPRFSTQVFGLAGKYLLPQCNSTSTKPSQQITTNFSVATFSNPNRICYTYDQVNWEPSASANNLFSTGANCVGFNGTMWVVGGTSTSAAAYTLGYSYDGINWIGITTSYASIFTSCLGIATNGSIWVAVGQGSCQTAYSYDGINWTPNGTGTAGASPTQTIVWNGSLFIATNANALTNNITYSSDGINWSATSLAATGLYGLASNGQTTVAVGDNGTDNTISYSLDGGLTWTGLGLAIFSETGFGVATNGSIWVSVGQNTDDTNIIAYSFNGVNWFIAPNNPLFSQITNTQFYISWTGSMFLIGASTKVLYSYDGINWNIYPNLSEINSNLRQVASRNLLPYGQSQISKLQPALTDNFIVGLSNGSSSIGYSYDGLVWNSSLSGSSLFTTKGNVAAWNGQLWVAGGQGTNNTAYSKDGIIWYTSSGPFTSCNAIAWNGNLWVAGGTNASNTLAYSYNGTSWTSNGNTIFSTQCNGIAWNGFVFIAVGSGTNTIAFSYDGINWTGLGTSIFSTSGNCIAWNGQNWLAGGSGTNTYAFSTTGITSGSWTGASSTITTQVNAIAWNGFRWIAVGTGTNTIAYTSNSNGTSWTGNNTMFTTSGNSVAWNGSYWILGGTGNNTLVTTKDPATYGYTASKSGNNIFKTTSILNGLASRRILPQIGNTPASRRTLYGSDTTSSGTLNITFSPSQYFAGIPSVTATITGATAGFITVTSITASGFTVNTFNVAGTLTNYSFNWQAVL